MHEEDFTETLKAAITYNQLERYFTPKDSDLDRLTNHFEIAPDIKEIEKDRDSAGGLKLSHAQRRMLILLVALWNGREADRIFAEGIGSFPKLLHSMDRNNRELVADLIITYPGWGN
ncbi:hypothetical protein [Sneathiella glossodoripedis]|uniref:hypothetical protein n=1 Tax=Sneathiella glossodoripedis TaxID=418853 RepID=UPI00046E69BC|nr:hypothetical protein [Sneathiella glossodoripedis]